MDKKIQNDNLSFSQSTAALTQESVRRDDDRTMAKLAIVQGHAALTQERRLRTENSSDQFGHLRCDNMTDIALPIRAARGPSQHTNGGSMGWAIEAMASKPPVPAP